MKSWREFKSEFKRPEKPPPETPANILYVSMMVEMSSGRILPKTINWKDLPIEVKIFFKEALLRMQTSP